MGPLDVFVGWQALLLAVIVYMATETTKTLLDLAYGNRLARPGHTATWRTKRIVGRAMRRGSRLCTRVLLPALPPLLGALVAVVIPVRPPSLDAYVVARAMEGPAVLVLYAAWGAACGQFADYLYSKVKSLIRHGGAL